MSYAPNYTITSKILSLVGQIDAAREVITTAPLVPAWERRFQTEARARIVHHGTHLEGNNLNLTEVEQIIDQNEHGSPGATGILLDRNARLPAEQGSSADERRLLNVSQTKYSGALYHLDTWRLADPTEIESTLHLSSLLKPGNLVVIEWVQKVASELETCKKDAATLVINIKELDASTRQIDYSFSTPEWD